MCACKYKVGKTADALNSNFQNFISVHDFASGDAQSIFDFAYCISPEKVAAAFKPFDLEIKNAGDVKVLAEAHQKGLDKQHYKTDFREVLNKISFTQAELKSSSCKTMFVKQ